MSTVQHLDPYKRLVEAHPDRRALFDPLFAFANDLGWGQLRVTPSITRHAAELLTELYQQLTAQEDNQ